MSLKQARCVSVVQALERSATAGTRECAANHPFLAGKDFTMSAKEAHAMFANA